MTLSTADKRKAILEALGEDRELAVKELIQASGLSSSAIIQHLPPMLSAHLVERRFSKSTGIHLYRRRPR